MTKATIDRLIARRTVHPRECGPAPAGFLRMVMGAGQEADYQPLPAWRDTATEQGYVVTAWALTWRQRLWLLIGRPLTISLLTFKRPLQPLHVSIGAPLDVLEYVDAHTAAKE